MIHLDIRWSQFAIPTRSIDKVRSHDITIIMGYLAQVLSEKTIRIPPEFRERKKRNIVIILDTILNHLASTDNPEDSLLEGKIPRSVFPNSKKEFSLMDLLGNNKFVEFSTNADILLIDLGLYDAYYQTNTTNSSTLSISEKTLREALDIVFFKNETKVPLEARLGRYLEFTIKDGIIRFSDAVKPSTKNIDDIITSVQEKYDELMMFVPKIL